MKWLFPLIVSGERSQLHEGLIRGRHKGLLYTEYSMEADAELASNIASIVRGRETETTRMSKTDSVTHLLGSLML